MQKLLSNLFYYSVALACLCSCNRMEEPISFMQGMHSAYFDGKIAEVGDENMTKGLNLIAMPNWTGTQTNNIHLYENGIEGTNPVMDIDEDDSRIAHFTAQFKGESSESGYKYNAIIAPSVENEFVVPSEQHPTKDAKIDPNADFLIGRSITSSNPYGETTPVNMDFVRPVSLFRLAIVNLPDGENVKEVKFNTNKPLTGKFMYDDVEFETGTVVFNQDEGSNTVTLKYDDLAESQIIFYAYYVICPVKDVDINSVVVTTDKGEYTKEYNNNTFTFTNGKFYSIAVDMADAKKSAKSWYVSTEIEAGKDYVIVSNGYALKNNNGTVEAVKVVDNGGIIEIDDAELVWRAEKPQTELTEGTYTFTNAGKSFYRISNSDNLSLGIAEVPSPITKYYLWDYQDNHLVHTSNSYFYWFYYKDGKWNFTYNKDISSENATMIYCSEKPKTSRNLFFSESSVSKNVHDENFKNDLNGVKDGVSYSSSDIKVATVDENGEVTIKSVGIAEITASAPETDIYKADEVSFTLTVVDPSSEVGNYVLVTSDSDITDGEYILAAISSNSGSYYFFDKTATNFKSEDMTSIIVNNKIESNSTTDPYAVSITKSGDNIKIYVPDKGYMYYANNIDFLSDVNDDKAIHTFSVINTNGDCNLGNKGTHSHTYYFSYGANNKNYFQYNISSKVGTILLFKLIKKEG